MSKKIICIIREDKNKQRRITNPKEEKTLKDGDYVEIKKLELKWNHKKKHGEHED